MKKNAFTLVELLVSITIFGLIAMLMFGTIDNLRGQLRFYQEQEGELIRKNRILSLLRSDFDRPQTLKVLATSNPAYDTVVVEGSNRSLYGMRDPYVTWVILKRDRTLVRLESSEAITLPVLPEALYLVHSDVVGRNCDTFRVYEANQSRLIYLQCSEQSPLILQTSK